MRQRGGGLLEVPSEQPWDAEGEELQERAFFGAPTEPEEPRREEEPPPPEHYLGQARSLLTELRPSGFGELLVTEAWLAPTPSETADERPTEEERQRAWSRRQELRQLGLLRERPVLSYDARTEDYWGHVAAALEAAPQAITDPYTHFAAAFAEADPSQLPDFQRDLREYGREAEAWVGIGKAFVVIGRMKAALAAFRAAAKAEPFYPQAWLNLGLCQIFARANAKAVASLTRAAEQSPGDLTAELGLAVAHYHAKDYARAEERFRRIAGTTGVRAAARSFLACSLRLQGKWDEARSELHLLQNSGHPGWMALAQQCRDCVQRGEERRAGPKADRRRLLSILATAGSVAGGGAWVWYSLLHDYFKYQPQLVAGPLLVLFMILARAVRGISRQESAGEFGNAEQGLPCWQATTWVRPRKPEL